MTNMKQLQKITTEVRKQITELSRTLPNVPYFMEGKNGMVPQRVDSGRRISAAEVPDEEKKRIGISMSGYYVQRNKQVRLMNHKVNLNTSFQNDGQQGIIAYCAYINQLHAMLSKAREPKAEVSAVSVQQDEHLDNQPETTLTK